MSERAISITGNGSIRHMNVLIASCGTRNKIIQYFKRAMAGRGRVVATDCNPNAPALYDADCHYIVPDTYNY